MLANYEMDRFGVIHQLDFTPIAYNREYISYYESKSSRTIKLGYLRMGWLLGHLEHMPASILEIGYGTGTFIEAARILGVSDCAGNDITRFPLPEGVRFEDWEGCLSRHWEVVALFDVLEHIPDLSFLSRLDARYLAIAVPWCRYRQLGDSADLWFADWRMRLPNEHLHHFDPQSLDALLGFHGFKRVTCNHFEDGLRLRDGETGPNILSVLYRRE